MTYRALLVNAVVCGTVSVLISGAIAKEPTMDVFARLRSEDPAIRDTAAAEIMAARGTTIRKCEEIVRDSIRDENHKGTTKTSILLLGKLRSQESVPLLVEHLPYEVFYKDTKRPQIFEDRCPCVKALIEIGVPSVDRVVEKTKKSRDEKVTRCAAAVLRGVLGAGAGRAYVQEKMARTADVTEKEGLMRILKAIQE